MQSMVRAVSVFRCPQFFFLFTACLGGVALLGHILDFELLFRPLAGRGGTHEITAILLIGLAFSFPQYRAGTLTWMSTVFMILTILFCSYSLVNPELFCHSGSGFTVFRTPKALAETVCFERNTAVMLGLLAAAVLLHQQAIIVGQMLISVALFLPLVAAISPAFGVRGGTGEMSVLIMIAGPSLGLGLLLGIGNKGVFIPLLKKRPAVKSIFKALVASISLVFFTGLLLAHWSSGLVVQHWLAVSSTVAIGLMILVSLVMIFRINQNDDGRRINIRDEKNSLR